MLCIIWLCKIIYLCGKLSKHLEIMEDFRSIAYTLKPTADYLHDYMLRSFKSEGKNRSGSTPYSNKRNRKKKNRPRRK